VRGLANSETVQGFAAALSVAPLTYPLRSEDGDRVMFCFAKAEDAQLFAERFGSERLSAGN
jgi:hypothetical protein